MVVTTLKICAENRAPIVSLWTGALLKEIGREYWRRMLTTVKSVTGTKLRSPGSNVVRAAFPGMIDAAPPNKKNLGANGFAESAINARAPLALSAANAAL